MRLGINGGNNESVGPTTGEGVVPCGVSRSAHFCAVSDHRVRGLPPRKPIAQAFVIAENEKFKDR